MKDLLSGEIDSISGINPLEKAPRFIEETKEPITKYEDDEISYFLPPKSNYDNIIDLENVFNEDFIIKHEPISKDCDDSNPPHEQDLKGSNVEQGCDDYKKIYQCTECNQTFSNHDFLKQHSHSIHNRKFFKCSYCNSLFITEGALRVHNARKHDIVCKRCLLKVESEELLVEHEKIHENDPNPFSCKECGKGFLKKNRLVLHLRVSSRDPASERYYSIDTFQKNIEPAVSMLPYNRYLGYRYSISGIFMKPR